MIVEYHRPETQQDALKLLARNDPKTIVIGGGLYINEVLKDPLAVVDLQDLGLSAIDVKGKKIHYGASAVLQNILNHKKTPDSLKEAIRHQETYNRRQIATIGGTLIVGNGRSPISSVLLSLDPDVMLLEQDAKTHQLKLGDLLPLREESIIGKIITKVIVPLDVMGAYYYVARSPADLPIVAAAAVQWPSGRTRIVLAGYGDQPRLVLDGPDAEGAEIAARDAYSEAGDQWASAEYRSDVAAALVVRCLADFAENA